MKHLYNKMIGFLRNIKLLKELRVNKIEKTCKLFKNQNIISGRRVKQTPF